MTLFTNASQRIESLSGGNNGAPENCSFFKAVSPLTFDAGKFNSLWTAAGRPGAGAVPGGVVIPTRTTVGAFRHTNPGGGRQRFLSSLQLIPSAFNRTFLYDRLLHSSGLSGTSTSPQSVGTSIDRYTGADSIGNLMFIEIYTIIGTTNTTATVTYKDKDGTNRTSPAFSIGGSGFRAGTLMLQIPFANGAGQNSVTQIVDVTLAASTGTVGDFGVTILRPLGTIITNPYVTTNNVTGATQTFDNVEIKTDACLAMCVQLVGTGMEGFYGSYTTMER